VMDRELSNQWAAASAPPGSDCPGATVWREIAVGLAAPDETGSASNTPVAAIIVAGCCEKRLANLAI